MADDLRPTTAVDAAPEVAPAERMSLRTRLILVAIVLGVFVGGGALLAQWLAVGRYMISTDNAYVRADISVVSAQVAGFVSAAPAAENQAVRAGDVLVEFDTAEYRAALANAEAAVARARAQVNANGANARAAAAQLARSELLAERGLLSPTGLDAARAQAGQWSGQTAAAFADVAAAEARRAAAALDLERATVRAPIDGVIGNRQAQIGQYVRAGAALMSIVPRTLYVEANFKETQLARLAPGQSVTIRPDIDRTRTIAGRVDSFSPASGSEFSFIPTETATGNFTKIVQRVPVRIRLEESAAARALLRPGLSVTVTVDTRD